MRTYLCTLVATYEVQAENAAQANKAVRGRFGIRAIGDRAGGFYGKHERDAIICRVRKVSETLRMRPAVREGAR